MLQKFILDQFDTTNVTKRPLAHCTLSTYSGKLTFVYIQGGPFYGTHPNFSVGKADTEK